ncbi:MAG: dockerin, partial [Ruminococcus sp.]|nr:dockerin [Ruminococcus sp.]
MNKRRFFGVITAAAMIVSSMSISAGDMDTSIVASADEWYCAGNTCDPLHDTSRDIQKEGVGNPLG